jgi:drug/metabolite transporter (DMT)-like permease
MSEPRPNPRVSKTILFIAIAVIANSFGNLMLALGMDGMPAFQHIPLAHYLLGLLTNPFLIPGAALSAVYTLAQISLFSWADLSFVIPCTASSYALTTMLGELVLGEHVHWARWLGVVLITCGVVLVAETPVATKSHPRENPA